MKKLIETINGLEQYRDAGWTGINDYYRPFVADALELLKAQESRHQLEVHNIGNVDIPEGVSWEQFQAVMENVVDALEHTDRGESWPYEEVERMKHVDVLYLCDGQACQSENRSCVTDGLCKHTAKPEHAVNGYCERPDLAFDRFDEIQKFGFEGGSDSLVLFIERDDYVGKEAKA